MLAVTTFLAALALSSLGTFAAMKLGRRLGLVQTPGGRRQHPRPVSRIGGAGLLLGFLVVSAWLYWVGPRPADTNLHLPLLGVWLGTALALLGGLADDKYEFKAGPQFAIQFIAVLTALFTDVFIEEVTLPIFGKTKFEWFVVAPLTTFWVMGMMNTVNWLDGLDGLAGGVGAIAAGLFAIHSYQLQQPEVALYSLALAGACVGFVLFNFFPARVFLGSAGALGLGYALAALSIIAPARVATALLVMAIPIADVAFQIIHRWRRGLSPLQGDRGHLHFRLLDMGFSQRQIVVGYWILCALFGVAALWLPSPALKLIAILALSAFVIIVLFILSRRQSSGVSSSEAVKDP